MKKYLFTFLLLCFSTIVSFAGPTSTIKITVIPKEAAIYVNNEFMGYGFAEITRPKKKEMVALRIECEGYKPIDSKIYGSDKRSAISFQLQDDGFYRSTAASGLVNKFITISLDSSLYTINEAGKIDVSAAWKKLHNILLNYFEEIQTTDSHGGYLQTPWHYKSFMMSEKQVRTRVTVRDISTPDKIAFQIKVSSEVANAMAARHGEFTEVNRVVKELEPMIEELQTRLGKMYNL